MKESSVFLGEQLVSGKYTLKYLYQENKREETIVNIWGIWVKGAREFFELFLPCFDKSEIFKFQYF